MTPLEAHTGVKPDLSRLCVFGSRVLCKRPGKRAAKLDHHVYKGIFVGYGATDKHVRYVDAVTSQEKLATHVVFDEAHYTSHTRPPGAQLLYQLGMPQIEANAAEHLDHPHPVATYPPMPKDPFTRDTAQPCRCLLPLHEGTPCPQTAAAAKIDFVWDQADGAVVTLSPSCFD